MLFLIWMNYSICCLKKKSRKLRILLQNILLALLQEYDHIKLQVIFLFLLIVQVLLRITGENYSWKQVLPGQLTQSGK